MEQSKSGRQEHMYLSKGEVNRFYLGSEHRWHINPRCCRRRGEMESMGRKLGPRAPYVPHLSGFPPAHFHPFYLRLRTGRLRKVVAAFPRVLHCLPTMVLNSGLNQVM